MIKVLVVEDQAMVRGAISQLLSLESDIEVIGQARDGLEAIELIQQQDLDIVLTDIEMPNMSGLELAEHIRSHHTDIKVVIMTTFSKSGYMRRALDYGASGIILKEKPVDELIDTIKRVSTGQKFIDPELALLAVGDDDPLSEKERKALKLAADGLKTVEISEKLFLSEGTVRNYLSEAIAKLHAANRIDAARIAKQKGWI